MDGDVKKLREELDEALRSLSAERRKTARMIDALGAICIGTKRVRYGGPDEEARAAIRRAYDVASRALEEVGKANPAPIAPGCI